MFDQYKREINNVIKKLKGFEDVVKFVDGEIAYIKDVILSMQEGLAAIKGDNVQNVSQVSPVQAAEILKEEAIKAVEQTKEFDLPVFKNRLIAAILDPKTIRIEQRYGRTLVIIDLNATAGTLMDYSEAVRTTRLQLKLGRTAGKKKLSGSGADAANLASHMWQEKYYRPAREGTSVPPGKKKNGEAKKDKTDKYKIDYFSTILTRIGNFKGLAPFWEVIDQGTAYMAGNGGDAYPNFGGTHFVDIAKARIEKLFTGSTTDSKNNITDVEKTLAQLQDKLSYLEQLAESFRKQDPGDILVDTIESRLKSKYPLADPIKLELLVQDILAGREVRARVELTASGSQDRVRIRTLELQRIIKQFRSR